jgi:hypothetical protein
MICLLNRAACHISNGDLCIQPANHIKSTLSGTARLQAEFLSIIFISVGTHTCTALPNSLIFPLKICVKHKMPVSVQKRTTRCAQVKLIQSRVKL